MPVHSVEPLALSVVDPVMDGRLAHVELLGDLVLGATPSDGGDDRLATKCLTIILLLMATSEERCGFSSPKYRRVIGIRWHKTDRDQVALGPLVISSTAERISHPDFHA